jgi:hypothetical protein
MGEELIHHMATDQMLIPLSGGAVHEHAPVVLDDFNVRWEGWVARGRVHELRVRRKLIAWGAVIALGAGVLYSLLRS